jgi:flagellar biosynthesis protein FliQ
MRRRMQINQYLPVRSAFLITTLVVGVMIGIFIGDTKTINCDISINYCAGLESINLRRSF